MVMLLKFFSKFPTSLVEKSKLLATNCQVIWFPHKALTSHLQGCPISPAHCFVVGFSCRRHCQDFLLNVLWIQLVSSYKFHLYTQTYPQFSQWIYQGHTLHSTSISCLPPPIIFQLHDVRDMPIFFLLNFSGMCLNHCKSIHSSELISKGTREMVAIPLTWQYEKGVQRVVG